MPPLERLYNVKTFVEELGGEEHAAEMVGRLRAACKGAGFDGLHLLGQYCWGSPSQLIAQGEQIRRIGLDCSFAYHWPTFGGGFRREQQQPSGREMIAAQRSIWQTQPQPNILTVSMGWDSEPWAMGYSRRQWPTRGGS